jgi:hypothetical protein
MYLSDQKWSALIIALVVLTMMTMMTTVFFERVFRFSERSNGIENSNAAYYKALWSIETALYTGSVNKYTPWNIKNITANAAMKSATGSALAASTGGTTIPVPGKWNSPYDKNYNIISLSEPVQIVIPEGITWGSVQFQFRIPPIQNTNTGVAVGTNSGYILWTLASSGVSLFASGESEIFRASMLDDSLQSIVLKEWTTNSWSSSSFNTFYTSNLYLSPISLGNACTNYKCTLKLSLIRPVPTADNRTMTFLEYKISGFTTSIPSQYMDLHAEWYSYGFLRSRDIQFPQITTNTALDFAVLQ